MAACAASLVLSEFIAFNIEFVRAPSIVVFY